MSPEQTLGGDRKKVKSHKMTLYQFTQVRAAGAQGLGELGSFQRGHRCHLAQVPQTQLKASSPPHCAQNSSLFT